MYYGLKTCGTLGSKQRQLTEQQKLRMSFNEMIPQDSFKCAFYIVIYLIQFSLGLIWSGIFEILDARESGGFKSPFLRSQKVRYPFLPYYACAFYQVFYTCSNYLIQKNKQFWITLQRFQMKCSKNSCKN